MRIIHYYNQNKEHRTVEFAQVMKQWIEMNGGISKVLKDINTMTGVEKSSIQFAFLSFFTEKYNCTLPEFGNDFFQPEIFQPEIYHQAIFNLQYEHNTRPTSGYNIVIYIIIGLAIFGLLKMCS